MDRRDFYYHCEWKIADAHEVVSYKDVGGCL